jgi:hypothetical protein
MATESISFDFDRRSLGIIHIKLLNMMTDRLHEVLLSGYDVLGGEGSVDWDRQTVGPNEGNAARWLPRFRNICVGIKIIFLSESWFDRECVCELPSRREISMGIFSQMRSTIIGRVVSVQNFFRV